MKGTKMFDDVELRNARAPQKVIYEGHSHRRLKTVKDSKSLTSPHRSHHHLQEIE